MRHVRDIGFLPENEIHSRSAGSTPYEVGHDDKRYPLERVFAAAEPASSLRPEALPRLKEALHDGDSAVRYWGALGIRMRGKDGVTEARAELRKALADDAPAVRIAAAEALGKFGDADDARRALAVLLELAPLEKNGLYVSVEALNALDELGEKAAPGIDVIKSAGKGSEKLPQRVREYVPRLIEAITAKVGR